MEQTKTQISGLSRETLVMPGDTLHEFMQEKSMTIKEFAKKLNISVSQLKKIFSGEEEITVYIANRLQEFFDSPAKFWTTLEKNYREKLKEVSARYSAEQIACWFIKRNKKDDTEPLGNMKLHKLLYYAQGCYLAFNDKPLFDESIFAYTHGPVVDSILEKYKGNRSIQNCDNVVLDDETENFLEKVYKMFGQYAAWKLREMTHNEMPWKDTEQSSIITQNMIQDYFQKKWLSKIR